MSGFMFSDLDIDTLLLFAEEEEPDIEWTEFAKISNEHLAVWGWDIDRQYVLALAIKKTRSVEETKYMEKICKRKLTEKELDALNGWDVKFICEEEEPVLVPPREFLKTRFKVL